MTTNIKDYSTTQASNISLNGIDTNEGMLPSSLNNAIRALMKNTRDWFNDAQWIEYGDGSGAATIAYASSTSFTIAGANVTSIYHVGRRVKIIATTPGTIFGTITAVTFSTNTTVTVVFDSGSLSNEAINVYIGALSKIGSSIPAEIITTASLANGSVTAVKLAVNSVTTDKILNANVTLAKLASDSVDGSKIVDDSINSEHYVDGSIDTQHIADSQITLAKMASNSVNSAKIVDDSIVNADINSSAAISLSKLENLTTARALVSDGSGDVSVSAVTSTEIGHLDGVTSAIQTQINSKQQTITGSATTIDTESLTANRAVISNGSQKIAVSDVTSTELGYLDGVSSAIQTQLNSKQQTITGAATTIDTENLTASRALTSNGSGKVEVSDVTSTELGFLDGVSSSIQNQLNGLQTNNANLTAIGNLAKTDGNLIVGNGSTWVAENGATARTSLGLGSVATQAANNVSISGGSVTGLGEPSNNADAATKSYVDQSVAGLRTRLIAECASTANVNISNGLEAGDTIDGITLVAGDRILLKNQSTATANGLYIAVANGAGAASRDPEHDTIAELSGGMIVVNQGSANDNKIFLCTTDSNGSIGSTAITYTQVTPSNSGTVTSIATGTGINGGTITSTGTLSIDSTVATLSGTQTLTNKTLNSPKVNENVAVTSTATEINKLDAVSRGSLIYGNPSAATAILTKGGAGTVLTSDGTDIAWQSSAAAAITSTANGANNRIATYTGAAGLNGEANLTFDGSTFVTAGLTITSDPKLSATGSGSNIDLDLLAKGTGHVTIRGNSNPGTIQFNCESNSHGQQLKAQPHSVGSSTVSTLPNVTGELIPGKVAGTNFTNSLLIGHSTTGTLNNANLNTGVGIQALDALTSGDSNTALGYASASLINSGVQNTAIGDGSLPNVTSTISNVGVGYQAGKNGTGNRNIYIGENAGRHHSSGNGKVIIGGGDLGTTGNTSSRVLEIHGYDGSTRTTWITGDSSGNLTFPAEVAAVSLDISGNVDVDGTLETDALSIASTAVTSTAAELNILDGVTSTAAELNILDGVTSTAAEINKLDAVSRGSIIYGNSSAATDILTKGGAGTVLTSDGTDIAWSTPESGGTDWQSSIVTGSTLTAAAGNGYWINTSSNICTITLPGSPSVGDTIIFVDYARTWGTNKITFNLNSLKFQGNTTPLPVYDTNGQSVTLVYSGTAQGWIPTVDDAVSLETPQTQDIDFLVIAGGGGGSGYYWGGGGGAGGYRTSTQSTSLASNIAITVTIGAGGGGGSGNASGAKGSNSSISGSGFTTITSTGGGLGQGNTATGTGNTGGSGGGGMTNTGGGAGNTPSTSPSQGNDGSSGHPGNAGGGGGGSGGDATDASANTGGNAGAGTASSITGSSVTRAGGGGGGADSTAGNGGSGGGSPGVTSGNASAATVNTGSGGGGVGPASGSGGAGGSGVVILSLATAFYSGTTSGSPTVSTSGSNTILTFNASGSYTT